MNKYTRKIFNVKLVFVYTKYTRVLLNLLGNYTVKMDINRYYLLPNCAALKLASQKHEYKYWLEYVLSRRDLGIGVLNLMYVSGAR